MEESEPRSKSFSNQILSEGKFSGVFAGWGVSRIIALKASKEGDLQPIADTGGEVLSEVSGEGPKHHAEVGLTPMFSISIAGCDLMGSCLYTAGICAASSGKLAPVCLILVTVMLFFFRRVYSEVVTAIPVNGGTYNVMLNTATKKIAAFVACLSMLSYIATAILSAFDAVIYLSILWPSVDIRGFTIIIMVFFGVLCMAGAGESSFVAFGIFVLHMTVLTILILWCFAHGIQDNFQIFKDNINTPYPNIVSSSGSTLAENSAGAALFFGYCSALLGITGFETAANYVEEMRDPGVFVTTVDWLWVFVGFYNPAIMIVAMMVMPMDDIYVFSGDMLAEMAHIVGGDGFHTVMAVDALIVLCGAVITAIIGVSGLLKRLANDKVLPEFLGRMNSRGSAYYSIIAFTVLCISLFLAIFNPNNPTEIGSFGGVYTISFLSVLVGFAGAAILLKLYRPKLARLVIAKWWQIIASLLCVLLGLIGNIVLTPEVFNLFLIYLVGFIGVAAYMFMKVELFSFGIWMVRKMSLTRDKQEESRRFDLEILEACEKQSSYDEKTQFMSFLNADEMQQSQYIPASESEKKKAIPSQIMSSFKKLKARASFMGGSVHEGGVNAPHRSSFTSTEGSTPHRGSVSSEAGLQMGHRSSFTGSSNNAGDFTAELGAHEPHADHVLSWGEGMIVNVRRRMSISSVGDHGGGGGGHHGATLKSLKRTESMLELDGIMVRPILGRMLNYFMSSLDSIVSAPFVYLAKSSDPIAVHQAVEYICANELSNNIYVVHFMDDRKAIRHHNTFRNRVYKEVRFGRMDKAEADRKCNSLLLQMFTDGTSSLAGGDGGFEASNFSINDATKGLSTTAKRLVNTVAILDTFYTYKKIHCIVVRGAYFCPAAVECLSNHLNVSRNSMIMGVPDHSFPFPFAKLKGVRLAVSKSDAATVASTQEHLRKLLGNDVFNTIMKSSDDKELNNLIAQGEEEHKGPTVTSEEPMFDISQLPDDTTEEKQALGGAPDAEETIVLPRTRKHVPLGDDEHDVEYGAVNTVDEEEDHTPRTAAETEEVKTQEDAHHRYHNEFDGIELNSPHYQNDI